jgi:hypothetical protein
MWVKTTEICLTFCSLILEYVCEVIINYQKHPIFDLLTTTTTTVLNALSSEERHEATN